MINNVTEPIRDTFRRQDILLIAICRACRLPMPQLCQSVACSKRSYWGLPGGPPLTCAEHKEPGMIDVRSKFCDYPGGCSVHPSFGQPGSPASRCSAHKESGMVNVYAKRCDYPGGCTLHRSFGLPGSPATRCSAHKETGMVTHDGRHCNHPAGCALRPNFGLPGNTATRCSAHKDIGMIDVLSKRCDHAVGCNKIPSFGPPGSKATRCSAHKEPGMVNVLAKRCGFPGGCDTLASFGPPGSKAIRCSVHKEPGMVDLKHPSKCPRSAPSCSRDRESGPDQDLAMPAAAAAAAAAYAGGARDGGTRGIVGSGYAVAGNPTVSAGAGSPQSAATAVSGGIARPLDSSSPPALSRQHPALQPQLVPLPAPLPPCAAALSSAATAAVVPSSDAAARGGRRRPRQEAKATNKEDARGTSKKPRGGEPAPTAQAAQPGASLAQVEPISTAMVALASPIQPAPFAAIAIAPHDPSSREIAQVLLASRSQAVTVSPPPAAPSPAASVPQLLVALAPPPAGHFRVAPSPLLGTGSSGRGAGAAVKGEQAMWQVDAPFNSVIKAEPPSGAAAVTPPPANTPAPPPATVPLSTDAAATVSPPPSSTPATPAPPPAPVPFSSVLALEALLHRAVTLVAPLLPPPAPRFRVENWLDRWESRLRELEAHLDMRVVTEGCCFQRHLAAAVEGGETENCESMLRMIQLLT